jgi:hypothetical protein
MIKKMIQQLIVCGAMVCILFSTGCQKHLQESSQQPELRLPAKYEVVINRITTVDMKKASGQESPQTMTENLTVNLFLQPINTGQDQVMFKVACNSVHMLRTDFIGIPTDAEVLRDLEGKQFTLTFAEDGTLHDSSALLKLMKPAGKEALNKSCKGTFKESDMLTDFYDVVVGLCAASAKENYSVGEIYTQYVPTPTPAVEFTLPQREIANTVNQIKERDGVKIANISETHTIAADAPLDLPDIYVKGMKTGGLFSVLRRWRTESIEGSGEKVVDLKTGYCESLNQQWQVKATAGFSIPIRDAHPEITIDETVTAKQINTTKAVADLRK